MTAREQRSRAWPASTHRAFFPPMNDGTLPRVAVVATGGTIANTDEGRVDVDHVLAEIASRGWESAAQLARIETREVMRMGSGRLRPGDWITIAREVLSAAEGTDVAGVVVTHGTFTAEETAYFLNLTVRTERPIVVTCAQRKHDALSGDGDRNLIDAVRVACSPDAVGLGALLVANEEIHAARDVTKTSQRPGGFISPGFGPLGSIETDQVTIYRSVSRRHTARSEFGIPATLPRVDIVTAYPGADGALVEASVESGSKAIIVSGFAYNGRPHPDQLPALHNAANSGVAVVLTSRGGSGRIPVEQQEDLVGFVRADSLSAQKARILTMVTLAQLDVSDLERVFATY